MEMGRVAIELYAVLIDFRPSTSLSRAATIKQTNW